MISNQDTSLIRTPHYVILQPYIQYTYCSIHACISSCKAAMFTHNQFTTHALVSTVSLHAHALVLYSVFLHVHALVLYSVFLHVHALVLYSVFLHTHALVT